MVLHQLLRGRALYSESDKIWIAQGMTFFAIDAFGNRVSPRYHVGSLTERILSKNRILRQALRIGIHHIIPLQNGNFLVTAKKRTYIVSQEGGVISVFTRFQGNKPGHQGICIEPNGFIFFGEYVLNPKRDLYVRLLRSIDNGVSFNIVKEWMPGEIRHIHFVKYDRFSDCLWLGTGDYGEDNKECRLYKGTPNGDSWELVGSGSQDWRAIGVCICQDSLYWGTDAGSTYEKNHLVKMDKKTYKLQILDELEGPTHGCATTKDGRLYISTGVEGGKNELDKKARIKEIESDHDVLIYQNKKDFLPPVVQIGVLRFPLGTENTNELFVTSMGLKGMGEKILKICK